METPDITPVQVRALVLAVVAVLSGVGIGVGTDLSEAVIAALNGGLVFLSAVWTLADMVIRKARAQNASAILSTRSIYGQPGSPYVPGGVD